LTDTLDTVGQDLDRLISRRASQDRRPDPHEQEELWKASVRAHNARRREELRTAWCEYHLDRAASIRRNLEALAEDHEAAAARLQATDERKTA
jgi:hypothetical protein